MLKRILALSLIAFAGIAGAQVASQGQTTELNGTASSRIDSGAVSIVNNAAPELASKVVESRTSGELRTNAPLNVPGVYNASGTYNCFGGAGIGGSGLWGAIGGSVTVGQDACYRLHLMDKAANRAAGAAQAGAAAEASAYKRVWEAGFCTFGEGKAMFEAAGLVCPQEEQRMKQAAAEADRQRAVAVLNDQPTTKVAGWQGANLADPYVAARAQQRGVSFNGGFASK